MMNVAIRRSCSLIIQRKNVPFALCPTTTSTCFSLFRSALPHASMLHQQQHITMTTQAALDTHQQNDLPRLPVPTVADTARKYLKTIAPLVTNDEFHETKKIVEQFQREAEPLQELLLKRAQTEANWLSQWWLDKTYLEWRLNLPIFYNPAVIIPRQSYRNFDDQLQYAAKFLHGTLHYRTLIDNNQLPLDRFGSDYLCMDQYTKLFGTCRIPAKNIDYLHLYHKSSHHHVAVFFQNNIYRLPVYDKQGNKLSAEIIYAQLKSLSDNQEKQIRLGHLTADERQLWAPIHAQLSAIPENKDLFETINDSLLVLCIDKENPLSDSNDEQTRAGLNALHGGGTRNNTANRWFDKTLQFIVGPNGYSGLNYEHSMAEGGMVTALVDYALDYCKTTPSLVETIQSSPLHRCHVVIPKEIEQSIIDSEKRVDKFIENCDLTICKYTNYGKQFAKQNKLSIDAIIQMGMQVAYYRIHGKCGATYESGSLRRYHLGRTETIRSCTREAQQFAHVMSEKHNETSIDAKYRLLLNAIQAHRQYTNDAINAKGIDRHLLGLRLISLENNLPKPALYDHFSYKRAMHYTLSTSQVASKNDCVMAFGPAVDDGYGICYNPCDNSIYYTVTTFKMNNNGTNVKQFSKTFDESLTAIRYLIEQNQTTKSKL